MKVFRKINLFEKIPLVPQKNKSDMVCAIEKYNFELCVIVSNFPFPLCHPTVSTVSCRELLWRAPHIRLCSVGPFPAGNAAQPTGDTRPGINTTPPENSSFVSPPSGANRGLIPARNHSFPSLPAGNNSAAPSAWNLAWKVPCIAAVLRDRRGGSGAAVAPSHFLLPPATSPSLS
jgi:hypothetical protein